MVELTIARTQADVEAVRIAELYATDSLLKHFTVPRFRLPDVTVHVPVAIIETEDLPKEGRTFLQLHRYSEIEKAVNETIDDHIKEKDVSISDTKRAQLRKKITSRLENLKTAGEIPKSIATITDTIAHDVVTVMRGDAQEKALDDQRELQTALRSKLIRFVQTPPRLRVLATTKDLREFGNSEHLVNLRLTFSEENVEWTVIEIQGKNQDRLTPE